MVFENSEKILVKNRQKHDKMNDELKQLHTRMEHEFERLCMLYFSGVFTEAQCADIDRNLMELWLRRWSEMRKKSTPRRPRAKGKKK